LNNTELLSAISDMMDQKLDEKLDKKLDEKFDKKLAPITQRLDNLTTKVDDLSSGFDNLSAKVDDLSSGFDNLSAKVDDLSSGFDNLSNNVDDLSSRVTNIELSLENDVVPRLSHIEQCYIDTYEHYQSGVKKLDDMHRDIEVIKLTVTDHSEELNKITGPYLVK